LAPIIGQSIIGAPLLKTESDGAQVYVHTDTSPSPGSRLSLVQASPARVERSRSLVQAHNSTRACWQSPVKSSRVNALRKK